MLSRRLDHLDISPPVFRDASSCVDADLGADLDTHHFTRLADGTNEVGKAAARSAADIQNTIALFQIEHFNGFLTHWLYEGSIEIGKGPEKAREAAVRWCEALASSIHRSDPRSHRRLTPGER